MKERLKWNARFLEISLYTETYFSARLSDFVHSIDWSNEGSFKGLGGEKGANEAHNIIREAKTRSLIKIV